MYSSGQQPTRLNLGAGRNPLPGYHNIDRATGEEVYPLTGYADDSCDEIRASHILEHFGHQDVPKVLAEWVRVLKPGGCLKVAVPDFEEVAKRYLKGEAIPTQSYVMGGQEDGSDYHKCIFDRESLQEVMARAGLERMGRWTSEIADCASYPISLNLMGFKPSSAIKPPLAGVVAILSCPRFGPTMHFRCADSAFPRLGIPYQIGHGAYWHQVLAEQMETCLADSGCEYVVTCDFDTVFRAADVLELYRIMRQRPDIDALFAVQNKRVHGTALFTMRDRAGELRSEVAMAELEEQRAVRCYTGHFGLTVFRAESLRRLPRPWFVARPNDAGRWGEGKVDADSRFWQDWDAAGLTAYAAPKVPVGHLEEMISWPGRELTPIYQTPNDYHDHGIPAEVER